MICSAVAAGSFAFAAQGWQVVEADERVRRQTAVNALEQRLRESSQKLARLPRLREASRQQPARERAPGRSPRSDWRAVADAASRAGVMLRAVTPASPTAAKPARAGASAGRALRLDGRADFFGLYTFLSGLSTLPILVVPEAIDIKEDKGALAFAATLEFFDLPPPSVPPAVGELAGGVAVARSLAGGILADPFGSGLSPTGRSAAVGRLVGIVQGDRHALALFEAASGTLAVTAVPGQMLGADRLVSIDARGVTLANRTGTRRVSLPEVER